MPDLNINHRLLAKSKADFLQLYLVIANCSFNVTTLLKIIRGIDNNRIHFYYKEACLYHTQTKSQVVDKIYVQIHANSDRFCFSTAKICAFQVGNGSCFNESFCIFFYFL